MNTTKGYELGWDSAIENDSPEYVILPNGDYDFEVVGFERARHPGSEKLPPCNKAIVSLKMTGTEGTAVIKRNFFLHSSTEGLICAFFTSLGLRKRGERYVMAWDKIVGCKGRCKVEQRSYIKRDGTEGVTNDIKQFYEPEEKPAVAYTPGKF